MAYTFTYDEHGKNMVIYTPGHWVWLIEGLGGKVVTSADYLYQASNEGGN